MSFSMSWGFLYLSLLTACFIKVVVSFNPSSVVGNLGYFPLFTTINHGALNNLVAKSPWTSVIISLESVFRHEIAAIKSIQNFIVFDVSCKVFALLLIFKRGKSKKKGEILMFN